MLPDIAAGRILDCGIDEGGDKADGTAEKGAANHPRPRAYLIARQFAVQRRKTRDMLQRIEDIEKVVEAEPIVAKAAIGRALLARRAHLVLWNIAFNGVPHQRPAEISIGIMRYGVAEHIGLLDIPEARSVPANMSQEVRNGGRWRGKAAKSAAERRLNCYKECPLRFFLVSRYNSLWVLEGNLCATRSITSMPRRVSPATFS